MASQAFMTEYFACSVALVVGTRLISPYASVAPLLDFEIPQDPCACLPTEKAFRSETLTLCADVCRVESVEEHSYQILLNFKFYKRDSIFTSHIDDRMSDRKQEHLKITGQRGAHPLVSVSEAPSLVENINFNTFSATYSGGRAAASGTKFYKRDMASLHHTSTTRSAIVKKNI
eukprot:6199027-Pleurochrysis_carterae.AAC.1